MKALDLKIRLLAMSMAASSPLVTTFATVYRPGVHQIKFGCESGKTADFTIDFSSIAATNSDVTTNCLMCNFSDGSNGGTPRTNFVTGKVWSWPKQYSAFGYEGEIWLVSNTTYYAWGQFDDGSAVLVNGTTVFTQGTSSGYNKAVSPGSYTPIRTGWYPFKAFVWDWTGGKSLMGGSFSATEWNTNGISTVTSVGDRTKWHEFADPGNMSFLRYGSSEPLLVLNTTSASGSTYTYDVTTRSVSNAVLTVCMGTADAGEDFASWTQTNVFAIAAGTNTADYAVTWSGTGTPWIKLRLAGADATSPFIAWSDAFEATLEPVVTASVSSYSYTNATFSASLSYLGLGAASARCYLEVSKNADMSSPVYSAVLGAAQTAVPATLSATVVGLLTNTTYYARVSATNSQNAASSSSIVSFTTLNPTAATVTGTYLGTGFSYGKFAWALVGYGDDSSSAGVYLDVSTDSAFAAYASFAAASVATNVLPASGFVNATNLVHATTYYARIRAVNTWGLAGVGDTMTFTTTDVPFRFSAIGATTAAAGLTVLCSVTELDSGASVNVSLKQGGAEVATWTASTAPTSCSRVLALASGASATVTYDFTCTLAGQPYAATVSQTVTGGKNVYVAGTLSDLSGFYPAVGDSVTLPAITTAGNFYRVLNESVAALAADGVTVNVLTNGGTGVEYWEMTATGVVLSATAPLISPPTPRGAGRVWLWNGPASTQTWRWHNPTNWICLSDFTRTGTGCPDAVDDVAMIFFWTNTATWGQSVAYIGGAAGTRVTLGELWAGTLKNEGRTIRVRSDGKATNELCFARSDGTPGLIQLCNSSVGGSDNWFRLGGADESTRLAVTMPGGLVLDGGFNEPTNRNFRHSWASVDYASLNIPAGRTFRLRNFNPAYSSMQSRFYLDGERWNDAHAVYYDTRCRLAGSGTFVNESRTTTWVGADLSGFTGTYLEQGLGPDGFDRNMDTFLGATNGANAAFVVAGWNPSGAINFSWPSAANHVGFAGRGNVHGYASLSFNPGNLMNYTNFVLRGGHLMLLAESNDSWTNNPQIVNRPYRLTVGDGYSTIYMNEQTTATRPTNALSCAVLAQESNGVVCISEPRTYSNTTNNRSWVKLGGFTDCAVGTASGDCGTSLAYPVVPWFTACRRVNNVDEFLFPSVDPAGVLRRPLTTTYKSLADAIASNGTAIAAANIEIDTSTNLALSADLTVNSLAYRGTTTIGTHGDLGGGRTLTVSSGGLILHGNARIGAAGGAANGALAFPVRGYVYGDGNNGAGYYSAIWAPVAAPAGVTFTALRYPLILGGDQTGIAKEVAVMHGTLQLGTSDAICNLGPIDLRIVGGASMVTVAKVGTLGGVSLKFDDIAGCPGKVQVPDGQTETVSNLYVDGVSMPHGTYGSTNAYAAVDYVDSAHFTGTGIIDVTHDDLAQPCFYIRIGESDLAIPYDWATNACPGVSPANTAAMTNALVASGANGVPRWQSYALGLDSKDPASVVLADAQRDAAPASVTLFARNVNPATATGLSVRYVLEGSHDGATWTDLSRSDTNALSVSLPSGYLFFRVRAEILLGE